MCKKPDDSQQALPPITCPLDRLCEPGWLPWGTSCYKMSDSDTTKKLDFFAAEKDCSDAENNARLADIRSEGENEFIKSITKGKIILWIGGTDNGTESSWR